MNPLLAASLTILTTALPVNAPAAAQAGWSSWASPSAPMTWTDCLREIGVATARLGVVPEVVEDAEGLHVVRFRTPDGILVIGCERGDPRPAIAFRG